MKKEKKTLYATLGAFIAVALCCFTPVLVGLLAVLGLAFVTPYLDMVLLPALGILFLLSLYSIWQYRKKVKHGTCCAVNQKEGELAAQDDDKKDTTNITCPKCGHMQVENIPQTHCQPFYICKGCGETISVPKESENCCVFCEYADKKCPVPNKK